MFCERKKSCTQWLELAHLQVGIGCCSCLGACAERHQHLQVGTWHSWEDRCCIAQHGTQGLEQVLAVIPHSRTHVRVICMRMRGVQGASVMVATVLVHGLRHGVHKHALECLPALNFKESGHHPPVMMALSSLSTVPKDWASCLVGPSSKAVASTHRPLSMMPRHSCAIAVLNMLPASSSMPAAASKPPTAAARCCSSSAAVSPA